MKLSKKPKGLSVVEHNDTLVAVLYNTKIVVKSQNEIVLNSGGWLTMHTKKCINLIARDLGLGFKVSQKSGQWFVTQNEKTVPFTDNMIVKVG